MNLVQMHDAQPARDRAECSSTQGELTDRVTKSGRNRLMTGPQRRPLFEGGQIEGS